MTRPPKHHIAQGVTSSDLFLSACPACTVRVEYRPVRDVWTTFVTHQGGCLHLGEQLTPAGWGRIT